MKRKIAILLSTVMIAGSMPVIASAGTSFDVKSYQGVATAVGTQIGTTPTITYDKVDPSKTVSALANREGLVVLDVTSQDFGGEVKAGDIITLKFENGDVGNSTTPYAYQNVNTAKKEMAELPAQGSVTTDVYLKSLMENPTWTAITKKMNDEFIADTTLSKDITLTPTHNPSTKELKLTFTSTVDMDKAKQEALNKFVTDFHTNNAELFKSTDAISPDVPYEVISAQDNTLKIKVLADVTSDKFTNKEINKFGALRTTSPSATGTKSFEAGIGMTKIGPDGKDTRLVVPVGAVKSSNEGDVKVTVTGWNNNNKLEEKIVTVGKAVSNSSSAVRTTIDEVKSFEDDTVLSSINVQEVASGMLNTTGGINLSFRLSNGYKFNAASVSKLTKDNVSVNAGFNKTDATFTLSNNDEELKVLVTGTKTSGPISLSVAPYTATGAATTGLKIQSINDRSSNYGDVSLRVESGSYRGDLVVAKRETLGFKLSTTADVPEIVAGRTWDSKELEGDNKVTANDLDERSFQSVKFKFSETAPNTLVPSRNLDLLLPEGVKIVGYDVKSTRGFSGLALGNNSGSFTIENDGKFLRLPKNTLTKATDGTIGSFELELNLSIDAGFKGDVTLNVEGGGQALDQTEGIVIAKAIQPFTIKTNTTNLNLGYQNYKTSDISIVENKIGSFMTDGNVTLKIAAPYGESEIGFSRADVETSGTELKVKNFKVNNDTITFNIDRSSYKEPATITIKNVQIGTSRSVPYGSYDLDLYGSSLINNCSDQNNLDGITSKEEKILAGNPTGKYIVKDYAKIVTATGTLDQEVRVSVGEKTVVIGGKAIDMDTAPYIQAESDSTMVPLRFVSVALGVDSANVEDADNSDKIQYDASSKTATIFYGAGSGQKLIQFQAGSNKMIVDGTRIPMANGVKAEIKEGRMFVPFRALGQALGIQVNWDADTRTAIYNQNAPSAVASATTESTTESTTKATTTESTTKATTETTTETTTK